MASFPTNGINSSSALPYLKLDELSVSTLHSDKESPSASQPKHKALGIAVLKFGNPDQVETPPILNRVDRGVNPVSSVSSPVARTSHYPVADNNIPESKGATSVQAGLSAVDNAPKCNLAIVTEQGRIILLGANNRNLKTIGMSPLGGQSVELLSIKSSGKLNQATLELNFLPDDPKQIDAFFAKLKELFPDIKNIHLKTAVTVNAAICRGFTYFRGLERLTMEPLNEKRVTGLKEFNESTIEALTLIGSTIGDRVEKIEAMFRGDIYFREFTFHACDGLTAEVFSTICKFRRIQTLSIIDCGHAMDAAFSQINNLQLLKKLTYWRSDGSRFEGPAFTLCLPQLEFHQINGVVAILSKETKAPELNLAENATPLAVAMPSKASETKGKHKVRPRCIIS